MRPVRGRHPSRVDPLLCRAVAHRRRRRGEVLRPQYDVLIAGGGYGAQAAARRLVGRGLRVLLCDRRFRPGYPPASTSGFAKKFVRQFALPVGGESAPITGFRVYGPENTEASLGHGLLGEVGEVMVEPDVIARMERASVERGLEARHGVTVFRVAEHDGEWRATLLPSGESVSARHLFDATGFHAWVGRQAGVVTDPSPEDMHGGVEVTVPRPATHPAGEVRMWLGHSVAPWGYAWGFPSVEDGAPMVRLGIGTPRVLPESAGVHFARFRSAHPEYDGPVHHRCGGVIPTAPVGAVLERRGLFLIGDAARLVCPVTGGGILGALASGEAAADAVVAGDPASYPERVRWLTDEMRWRWVLKQFIYGLRDPELAELVRVLGEIEMPPGGAIDPFAERRRISRWMVLHHPGLMSTLLTRGRLWRALRPGHAIAAG
jgi:digeranylgeranylglycerophospholipid reductase